MGNYTNKFILKADATDLEGALKKLEVNYTNTMDKIAESTKQVSVAEKALTENEKALTNILKEKKKYTDLNNASAANKKYKESIALAKQAIVISKREVAELKNKNVALKANATNIQASITKNRALVASHNQQVVSLRKVTQAQKAHTSGLVNSSNEVVRHIRHLESYAVALYSIKKAYDVTLGRGHDFNKLIETETIGLKLLISQNLKYEDSTGKKLTALERFTLSQTEANKAIQIARKVNLETPQNFAQTLQIYKALTGQVLSLGGGLEETGKLTKRLSILATASGLDFQSFLKTVDTVLTGEGKQSQLTLALARFGITNELIKEAAKNGGVLQLFEDKLKDVDVAGLALAQTWEGAANKFLNIWDEMFAEIQKPIFESLKSEMVDWSIAMKENKDDIVDTFKSIGTLSTYVLAGAKAYTAYKVATLLFNKAILQTNASTLLATRYNRAYGTSVSATALQLKKSALALKSFVVANAPLLALVVAFEALNYATQQQAEAQEELNDVLDVTISKYVKLNKESRADKISTLDVGIETTKEKLLELARAMDYVDGKNVGVAGGSSLSDLVETVGFWDSILDSNKDLSKEVREQITLKRQQLADLLKHKSILLGISEAQLQAGDALSDSKQKLLDQNVIYDELLNKYSKLVATGKEVTNEVAQQLSKHYDNKTALEENVEKAEKLVKSFDKSTSAVYNINEAVAATSEQMDKVVGKAYKLVDALRAGKLARGEISARDSIEEQYTLALIAAEKQGSLDEINFARIKAEDTRKTAIYKLDEQNAKDTIKAQNTTTSLRLRNLQLLGESKKAYELQVAIINDKEIPAKDKLLELDNLRLQYLKSQEKSSGSNAKALDKEIDKADELHRKYLEITGQDSEIFQLDVSETMAEFMASDEFMADTEKAMKKLSDIYNGMYEDFSDNGKEAVYGMAEAIDDLSKISVFDDMFDKMSDGFISGLGQIVVGYKAFSALLDGITLSSVWGAILFVGTSILNGLVGSGSSEIPPELEDFHKTSETMADSLSYIEDAQYAMLPLTRDMRGYLSDIANSFTGLSNNLLGSDIDFSGNLYNPTSSTGTLLGSDSLDLYATQISFDETSVNELMNGIVDATFTEIEEWIKTTWYGRTTTRYVPTDYDISADVSGYLSDITKSFFQSFEEAGSALNIDTSALGGLTIDIGNFETTGMTSDEITAEIARRYSAEIDSISETIFAELIPFQEMGEGLGETVYRVTTNMEQVTHSLDLLGIELEATVNSVTVNLPLLGEVTFDLQARIFELTEAMIAGAGGIDALNAGFSSYMDNFFTEQEQYEMQLNTMSIAFDQLGLAMPSTNDEFRALAEGLDLGTVAGAELFGELMTLADGFSEMTSASGELAEAQAQLAEEQAEAVTNMIKSVSDAWLGNLSYLTLQQKADYASGYLSIAGASNGTISTVDAARLAAETALKTTATKEEYIPVFERYISELENQTEDASRTDLLNELKALKIEVVSLKSSIAEAGIYA